MATLMVKLYRKITLPTYSYEPDSNMHEAVAAIAACGVSPIVRIAANEAWMVKRNC